MSQLLRSAVVACAVALALPTLALAGVKPGQAFPTNLDTTIDLTQLTGLRVSLPKPDCTTHPSDCSDIDVLNTLDGFSVDARVSIPFSGPIDLSGQFTAPWISGRMTAAAVAALLLIPIAIRLTVTRAKTR